jgi:serine/threonine protein kinase/Flp pilus assembly protein TadD
MRPVVRKPPLPARTAFGAAAMDEETIFLEALQRPTPAERMAYLSQACAGNVKLRHDVERLLAAHVAADGFLDTAPFGPSVDRPLAEAPGTVIGPYRLLEQIGEGGFGVVFMAEQLQPLRRKVALKVLKPGMDTRQVVARFEAERQALALMDHPHIARVFDGGETASGRPYFVMELVNGIPITEYADQCQLTLNLRLELFLAVCQAVQHAHQKGIIHRDLKPSNVLVTLHDGTPVVKVIDFGIAKATGQQLTDKTLFTNFAQLIGTPLYMSPEQAALSGLDVDTRCDIYCLGVLLYELLTCTTPFEKERFQHAGFDEICRIIREEDPPRPSTRLSALRQSAAGAPAYSERVVKRLGHLFRSELDWIVMKCLEKDRNRRYESAAGLARDVERYLRDEPVQACPPSRWYRCRKFARRHKRELATTGLVGILALVALGGIAGSLGWAARDRAAHLAVTNASARVALSEAQQLMDRKKWPEALEAAKRASGILAGEGSGALRARATNLRHELTMVLRLDEIRLPFWVGPRERDGESSGRAQAYASAFRQYGIDVLTLEPQQVAARIRARPIRLELTVALYEWAREERFSQQSNDASWKRLAAIARATEPDAWRNRVWDAWDRSDLLEKLASSPEVRDQPARTLSLLGQVMSSTSGDSMRNIRVLQLAQQRYPDDFTINFQLGWAYQCGVNNNREAIRFYSVALALRPANIPTHLVLGDCLREDGRLGEAAAVYVRGIALERDAQLVERIPRLVTAYRDSGNLEQAAAFLAELLDLGPLDRVSTRQTRDLLAETVNRCYFDIGPRLGSAGREAEALRIFNKLLERVPRNATLLNNLAWFLATCRDPNFRNPDRSVELARKAVRLDPRSQANWNTLGAASYRAGDPQAALEALRKSMDLGKGGNSYDWLFVAMAESRLGHKDEARRWYEKALAEMQRAHAPNEELDGFRIEAEAMMGAGSGSSAPD